MSATYYPQAALTGFAQALSAKLGVNVQFATGQPRTDGSTVYLPTITQALNEGEFAALCGIAIHEAAHVYFGSCPRMAQYATDALKAQCFNAVLDVADETRIEGFVSSAQKLLAQSNLSASRRIVDTDALRKGDPVWAVLAAGILWVRIGRLGAHYKPARKLPHYGLMVKAYQILKRCRTRRTGRGPKRYRTRAQWSSLKASAGQTGGPAQVPRRCFGRTAGRVQNCGHWERGQRVGRRAAHARRYAGGDDRLRTGWG